MIKKIFQKWKYLIIGIAITPLALLCGLASTGMGHGDYIVTRILFPYSMLLIIKNIYFLTFEIAIIQYPLYGLILDMFKNKKVFTTVVSITCFLHILIALLTLTILSDNSFS